jgi:phosphonatase-like hydrolase
VISRTRGGFEVPIELVVFDMAGTTVNDEDSVSRCLQAALEAVGVAVSVADVNEVMGIAKPEAIRLLVGKAKGREELTGRIDDIHQDFVARAICFYETDPSVHEVPGASQMFRTLKEAGMKVALDTGFNRAITQVILDRLAWSGSPLIDATICSDEVPRGRPHPDMIRELMRRLGIVDPASVAKVGDTPADLQEGRNAGCGLIIGVTEGTHSREQLERHPHTHLIDSIKGLPALLGAARR